MRIEESHFHRNGFRDANPLRLRLAEVCRVGSKFDIFEFLRRQLDRDRIFNSRHHLFGHQPCVQVLELAHRRLSVDRLRHAQGPDLDDFFWQEIRQIARHRLFGHRQTGRQDNTHDTECKPFHEASFTLFPRDTE